MPEAHLLTKLGDFLTFRVKKIEERSHKILFPSYPHSVYVS